jgi:hypothetical protein
MSQTPTPPCPPPEKPRCWFTWRKLSVGLLFLFGFFGYTAYTLKETYLVTAAHVKVSIIAGQLQLFTARSQPEPLTLETAIALLQKDHEDVATDGSGRYNLIQVRGRFVIFTHVMREGFALNRVVVVRTPENGSEALPEAEFMARKKAGNL